MKPYRGIILVYSITSRASFDYTVKVHNNITRALKGRYMPFLLMGNKTDCAAKRQVKTSGDRAAARSLRCGFYEVSAKTGQRGEQTMHDIL